MKDMMGKIEIRMTFLAALLILVFSFLFAPFTVADERSTKDKTLIAKLSLDKPNDATIYQVIDTNDIALKKEINLLLDLSDEYNVNGIKLARNERDNSEADETEFVYTKSVIPEYETESIEAGDILRLIPSISTEDKKTIGFIIPLYAYFAKKF